MNLIKDELEKLKEKGLFRRLRLLEGEQSSRVRINGKEVILLSSNNYLGLTSHPDLKERAIDAIKRYGCGAGASRLISGNMELHERTEKRIAEFKRTESALIFNSGYTANIGVIAALCSKGDIVISDKLNHASIIDGSLISRADTKRYPHKDIHALEKALRNSSGYRRRLIVTDGIFSMDGDIAPLPEIVKLAERYSAILMLDDAHATGVLGANGRGTGEYFGLEKGIDIQMGTLGKALGGFGAYIAGEKRLTDFLINKCRSFIYTTALPPSVLASTLAALDIIENGHDMRTRLWGNVKHLRDGLIRLGFDTMGSETQIIPVLTGDAATTVKISEMLFEEGIYVQGIRPPTVPEGSSRLRITVMATHSLNDLDKALEAFEEVARRYRNFLLTKETP
ncbi:MAG: 8-amino-7-oxononanoate synthase [Nitrospinota bacterium]